jgi:hypothetical protein
LSPRDGGGDLSGLGHFLLQFGSPRFQRSMSYCILAASSGGILRFSVLTTVAEPSCLKSIA